jgi:hypothetical protein
MPDSTIPLADLIDAVRAELQASAEAARDEQLQFEVQEVELDVEITATGTREGSGGLKIYVLNLGAKASSTDTAVHRVKLKLGAVGRDGTKYHVSDVDEIDQG